MIKTLTVSSTEAGQRLDIFCVQHAAEYSRAVIQKAIKQGDITVNDEPVKARYLVQENDTVRLSLEEPEPVGEIEDIQLPILHEDQHIVAINKPAGIAVHPGVGPAQATVASWFANRYPQAKNIGEDKTRPGIVHRLDKDTSGVLLLAKTPDSYQHLKEQFKKRRVKKEYVALVFGVPGGTDGRITRRLARSRRNPLRRTIDPEGKPAITEWRKEQAFGGDYALLRLWPVTGRTHQLRVHLHFLGHPIVGDQLYTFKRQRPPHGVTHQLLHAEKITVTLPSRKRMTLAAPLPEDFKATLATLAEQHDVPATN